MAPLKKAEKIKTAWEANVCVSFSGFPDKVLSFFIRNKTREEASLCQLHM